MQLRDIDLNLLVVFQQLMLEQRVSGVAETLDWAEALQHLGTETLTREVVQATLGMILKYQDDVNSLRGPVLDTILEELATEPLNR